MSKGHKALLRLLAFNEKIALMSTLQLKELGEEYTLFCTQFKLLFIAQLFLHTYNVELFVYVSIFKSTF